MQIYVVENNPVTVYSNPGAGGRPINAYQPGSKVEVIKEDSGWLQTVNGGYIFKTDDIITFREYRKKHINDLVETEIVDGSVPPPLRKGIARLGGSLTTSDTVRVIGSGVTDIYNGNPVPSDWYDENARLSVKDVNGTEATIVDMATGNTYHLPVSSLERFDYEDNEWEDVSSVATLATDIKNDLIESITELVSRGTALATDHLIANLDVVNIRKVHGMPYQFLPWVDPRLTEKKYHETSDQTRFGRKYAQKIASRAPILVMKAGVPDFMRGYSRDENKSMMAELEQKVTSLGDDSLEQLVNTPGKLYSLREMTGPYFNAVDQMCQAMAALLGLGDVVWTVGEYSASLDDFEWLQASESPGMNYYGGSVGFYINSEPQINEAFSNGVTDSQLAQKMNDLGRMGSELQFYLGGISNYASTNLSGAVQEFTNSGTVSNGAAGIGGMIDTLIDNVQTVIAGGRMIFPKIWSDHQFSRSYNVTMKFDSPDCDNLSIYLNVLVPLAHVLAFVMPRSTGANNYVSPYMVRAYYKSMFHIDMGIITDCQITKGDVGAWNQMGLPTQITVQLTITDLYNVISLATGLRGASLVGNAGQMDYIANMCGINIDAPDLKRAFALWKAVKSPIFNLDELAGNYFQQLETMVMQSFNELTDRVIG